MLVLDDLIHIYGVLGIFLIIALFIFVVLYLSMKIDAYINDSNKKEKEKIKNIMKEIKQDEQE